MYRQNKLKEELDRLRRENEYLKCENISLRERNDACQLHIRNLQLELQVKEMCNRMPYLTIPKPIVVSSEAAKEMEENFKRMCEETKKYQKLEELKDE